MIHQYTIIKQLLIALILSTSSTLMYAQRDHKMESRERIEAARIGFFTDKLDLTPKQAEKFWPVFNEFSDKRRAFRADFKKQFEGKQRDELTDKDKLKILDHDIEMKEKELALTKEYKDRFMEILSIDQMLELKQAEDEFRRMLLDKMRHRQHGEKKEHMREKRQEEEHENRKKGPH